MFVRPKSGQPYRHPQTRQLHPATGFSASEQDLDIVRGIACGDLEECDPPAEAAPKAAKPKTPRAPRKPSKGAAAAADAAPAAEPAVIAS